MDYKKEIREYIELEERVLSKLDENAINEAMNVIMKTREIGSDVYVFGNGGSASTASHYVGDFNKGVSDALGGNLFRFHCLSDNMATMMAIANDYSYDDIFIKQLDGRLRREDVVIGISGSGNSKNVVKAIDYAKKIGATAIGVTGYSGGEVKKMCDISLHADVDDMQIAEDIHLVFNHLMMSVLCRMGK